MPKLFPIHIEVEELAVGKVMRLLNKMPGVAKLSLDMEREAKPNGHRQPRKPFKKFNEKAEDFVMGLLFKDPMPTAVLKQHFSEVGRSPLSVNSQMTEMKDKKLVTMRDGNWTLTKLARDRQRHRK